MNFDDTIPPPRGGLDPDEHERDPVQIEITTGELTVLISGPKRDAYEAAHAFACYDCPTFEVTR